MGVKSNWCGTKNVYWRPLDGDKKCELVLEEGSIKVCGEPAYHTCDCNIKLCCMNNFQGCGVRMCLKHAVINKNRCSLFGNTIIGYECVDCEPGFNLALCKKNLLSVINWILVLAILVIVAYFVGLIGPKYLE